MSNVITDTYLKRTDELEPDKARALQAIGGIALTIRANIFPYLKEVMPTIVRFLDPKKSKTLLDPALTLLNNLFEVVATELEEVVPFRQLLG